MKRTSINKLLLASLIVLSACALSGCSSKKEASSSDADTLTVLNYGKYIEPDVLTSFEKETGIKVNYEEYESPEEMYTKFTAGAIDYDLACTSEYMIERLIDEGYVKPIHYENIPHFSNIDQTYLDYSKAFDPENKYTIPYFFGTVGILYNKNMVDATKVHSWDILWDETYRDQIIMENSVRDSFIVPFKRLGYSVNTTDQSQMEEALDQLTAQKPLVYAYYVDESADEMIIEDAAMALVYSGEAAYAQDYNENLDYVVPDEGSNMWIDSWFIPKTCKNESGAEKFLDYLCRADIAMQNFDYVYYATPNKAVYDALDPGTQQNTTIFPTKETLDNCEMFTYLDNDATSRYNYLWKKLKSN